jgi:hypothetical protein
MPTPSGVQLASTLPRVRDERGNAVVNEGGCACLGASDGLDGLGHGCFETKRAVNNRQVVVDGLGYAGDTALESEGEISNKIRVQPETHALLCGGGVDGSGKPMRAVTAHNEEHSEIEAAHAVEQRGHLVVAAACGADC